MSKLLRYAVLVILIYSIKGVGCQDSHWDYPFAPRVDAVRATSMLCVDLNAFARAVGIEDRLDFGVGERAAEDINLVY